MRAAAGRPARWRWAAASLFVVVGALAVLVFHGIVWPNRIFAAGYEVKGVDVAHYQGEIDWEKLASQSIDFAWIKATEGSSTSIRGSRRTGGARERPGCSSARTTS
ncbi:hypothetical protein K1T35_26675 [Pseudonocardia sp. DSM 110487]|nr:hypothetical protein K1T35_26675 [Pseudonocardia sp. DSM 110487]